MVCGDVRRVCGGCAVMYGDVWRVRGGVWGCAVGCAVVCGDVWRVCGDMRRGVLECVEGV